MSDGTGAPTDHETRSLHRAVVVVAAIGLTAALLGLGVWLVGGSTSRTRNSLRIASKPIAAVSTTGTQPLTSAVQATTPATEEPKPAETDPPAPQVAAAAPPATAPAAPPASLEPQCFIVVAQRYVTQPWPAGSATGTTIISEYVTGYASFQGHTANAVHMYRNGTLISSTNGFSLLGVTLIPGDVYSAQVDGDGWSTSCSKTI